MGPMSFIWNIIFTAGKCQTLSPRSDVKFVANSLYNFKKSVSIEFLFHLFYLFKKKTVENHIHAYLHTCSSAWKIDLIKI